MKALCATCGKACRLTDGREVYPRIPDLADKKLYACDPCGARVGCHPGTERPLGTAADVKTRNARIAVHSLLDPLWRDNYPAKRSQVYRYLAHSLNIDPSECHVGMFSAERCYAACDVLRNVKPEDLKDA